MTEEESQVKEINMNSVMFHVNLENARSVIFSFSTNQMRHRFKAFLALFSVYFHRNLCVCVWGVPATAACLLVVATEHLFRLLRDHNAHPTRFLVLARVLQPLKSTVISLA